jgi:hypothetical protein
MRYGMAWLRPQNTFMQAATEQVNAKGERETLTKRERRNESPAQSAWSEAIYIQRKVIHKVVASTLYWIRNFSAASTAT